MSKCFWRVKRQAFFFKQLSFFITYLCIGIPQRPIHSQGDNMKTKWGLFFFSYIASSGFANPEQQQQQRQQADLENPLPFVVICTEEDLEGKKAVQAFMNWKDAGYDGDSSCEGHHEWQRIEPASRR